MTWHTNTKHIIICYPRLARLDGVETGSRLLGTVLSPIVFREFGYYASFGARLGCSISAFLYVTLMVREPIQIAVKDEDQQDGPVGFGTKVWDKLHRYLFNPVKEMAMTLMKVRPHHLKILIFLQLFTYGLYWMRVDENLEYLYLLKTYEV